MIDYQELKKGDHEMNELWKKEWYKASYFHIYMSNDYAE